MSLSTVVYSDSIYVCLQNYLLCSTQKFEDYILNIPSVGVGASLCTFMKQLVTR